MARPVVSLSMYGWMIRLRSVRCFPFISQCDGGDTWLPHTQAHSEGSAWSRMAAKEVRPQLATILDILAWGPWGSVLVGVWGWLCFLFQCPRADGVVQLASS